MKNTTLLLFLVISGNCFAQYQYPETKKGNHKDQYWDKTIADPYRWLENADDSNTEVWIKAQNDFTEKILAEIPGQKDLINELKALGSENPLSYRDFKKGGDYYFYYKRLPNEEAPKIYQKNSITNQESLVFDPMQYKPGAQISFSVSENGKRLLLGIQEDGKEIGDFKIFDVSTRTMLTDVLPRTMFAEFIKGTDNQIAYFQLKNYDIQDPENPINPITKLHTIGTEVTKDKTILSAEKYPKILDGVGWVMLKSIEGSPFIFAVKSTASNYKEIYFASKNEIEKEVINWKRWNKLEDEIWNFWMDETTIYYLTSKNANGFALMKSSLSGAENYKPEIIFQEDKDWKISLYQDDAEIFKTKDYLVINLSKNNSQSKNLSYDFKTKKMKELKIPQQGNFTLIPFSTSSNICRATNFGWTTPNTYYQYDLEKNSFSEGSFLVKMNFKGQENLVSEEIEIPSHDGVLVPVSIIYNKLQRKKNATNIALMYGYGAYGTSLSPNFNPDFLPLLNRGVILVIAHVRGGGEKGNEWHKAGMKATKPNSWKDFNAIAEFLIQNKYTSSDKLACSGASAGGILIGRAITERPDLFKVALPKVAFLNPLRSMELPNSEGNYPEYGSPKDALEFKYLLEMDALYHINKKVRYPAILATAGYNDPRVPYFIPAKFVATMQETHSKENPFLLLVDYNAGHFGSASSDDFYKKTAQEYAFLLWQTGHKDFQVK